MVAGDVTKAQAGKGEVEAMWQGDAALISREGRAVLDCIGPPLVRRWYLSGAARCNGMLPAVPVYDGKTVGRRVVTYHYNRVHDVNKDPRIWGRRSDGGWKREMRGV